MASAHNYAQMTELSKHVAEWEEKVVPCLEAEDARAVFDVNTYGSNVIDNLNGGDMVRFRNIVEGKANHEICRTFLATLMLVSSCIVLHLYHSAY